MRERVLWGVLVGVGWGLAYQLGWMAGVGELSRAWQRELERRARALLAEE